MRNPNHYAIISIGDYMKSIENGNLIGEFDLYDYGLPTKKGYLFHQVSNGGNTGEKYPQNREYLRIIGFANDGSIIEYGYIYFMLYVSKEGFHLSKYIGSKVYEQYRNKGLGDLLMSIYLYYSYDNGFDMVESTTRQRKLDLLSLMNKYGFTVKEPEKYEDGERITIYRNNMVVDIYKQNKGGIYYKFKTTKAENVYKKNNAKVAGNYEYLNAESNEEELSDYKKLGWVVPNEDYERTNDDNAIVEDHLNKSGFSR